MGKAKGVGDGWVEASSTRGKWKAIEKLSGQLGESKGLDRVRVSFFFILACRDLFEGRIKLEYAHVAVKGD